HTPEVLTTDEMHHNPERYITVGAEGRDARTIKEAIQLIGPEKKEIVLMDAFHTEEGIVVDRDIVLHGLGSEATVLQAAGSPEEAENRVLQVEEGATVVIRNLTIRHGNAPGPYRSGAGIRNCGTLTLEYCDIRDNRAVYGAGIFNDGTLYLRFCTAAGNRTLPMTMKEKTDATGCTGSGGGIKNDPGAYLELDSCTISGNTSLRKGGGLFVACESMAKLTNCTVSGNASRQPGGGIHVRGDLELIHCTIANNSSNSGCGGLYNLGRLDMSGCLLASNTPGDFTTGTGGGIYGRGEFGACDYNFVADGSLGGAPGGDPGLGPLTDNGGPAMTHALKRRSPARNIIPPDEVEVHTDQRGRLRGEDRDRAADLGAYER
ncbi:MAG: choice-of-anchor Q domain-containing protein, partial [Sediminispirochaetaceae bacterium]